MGSFSIWHWLIVLVVVVLLFGTKKLRNVGGDLGSAIKSFRKGLQEGDDAGKDEMDKIKSESKEGQPTRSESARERSE